MADIISRALKYGNFAEAQKSNFLIQLSFPSLPESFKEIVKDTFKGSIECDITLAWRAISDGVTAQTDRTQEKYWRHWNDYCKQCGTDPYLHSVKPHEQAITLTAFYARVRTGDYGQGYQVRIQPVTDALTAISKTCQLIGEQSPIYQI